MQIEQQSKSYYTDFLIMRKDVRFFGKSLEEWVQSLTPRLPDEMTYDDVMKFSKLLDEAFIIAHNNYSLACGIHSLRKRNQEKESVKAYNEIKEKISLAQQERLVIEQTEEIRDMTVFAEFIENFWAQQVKLLEKRERLLTQIHWGLKNGDKI